MAIRLPKDLRSFRFRKLVPFELNDAQIDTLLPVLFQRIVLGGRDLASVSNDPTDIMGPVRKLAGNERILGFDSDEHLDLLDRILRTSIVSIGYKGTGRRKSDQQIAGLMPWSIGTFKVGFPRERTRMRGIDQFVYDLLIEKFRGDTDELLRDFMGTFGRGLYVEGFPKPNVRRQSGSHSNIDVLAELSIAYLESFDTIKPRNKAIDRTFPQPLPEYQSRFGEDIYRFLKTYQDRVPVILLTDQLVALIAFEIAVMSVRMLYSVPALMDGRVGYQYTPQIYVDFTGDPRHYSRLMAQRCVQRDRAQADRFIDVVLFFKYLDREVTGLRGEEEFRAEIESLIGPTTSPKPTLEYMEGLLRALDHNQLRPALDWGARDAVKKILKENLEASQADDNEEDELRSSDEATEIYNSHQTAIERVRAFLAASHTPKVRSDVFKWLASVGGVGTSYGLINSVSDRRSWAYAPTNDLLTVLVQICSTDYKGWHPNKRAEPSTIRLSNFLAWLEERFGIIVDRPPDGLGFDSPEHMAAARDNLQAMLRKLRQMGIFEDRSDDFTVQELTPPFTRESVIDNTLAGTSS